MQSLESDNEEIQTYDLINAETLAIISRRHLLTQIEANEKNYALQLNDMKMKYVRCS
jgi:hypothetical protein